MIKAYQDQLVLVVVVVVGCSSSSSSSMQINDSIWCRL